MAKTPKTTEPEAPAVALPSAAEARTELGRGLRIFQAFQAADRVLAVLENAEQVTAERNKAADSATQRLEAVKAELSAAEESRDQARQEARDIRADAKAAAANMLDAARAEATQITRAAQERLAELTRESEEIAALQAEARKLLQEAKAELADVQERAAKAKQAALATFGG